MHNINSNQFHNNLLQIPDIPNFNLVISMNSAKRKSLLTDFVFSKLKLPNIRKIKIGCISDGNKELNSFFKNWVPSKLDLLLLNYTRNTSTGIKMDFYIDSISKAIKSVQKEICLECFEIKEPELEQIVKSASDWERLILRFSDIYCSKKLDFGSSAKYKIKFLSFTFCGYTSSKERKSDWITTPSCFKNIVEAISKSGLKDSLEEVDIDNNNTLKKDEVQTMFNELRMSHISVVKIAPAPME